MIRVVLESLAQDTKNVSITNPELVLQTHDLSEVSSILRRVDEAVADGYVAAGMIAYEAGYHFLPGMPRISGGSFPLVWFALSRKYGTEPSFAPGEGETATVTDLALDTTLREYTEAIETIRSQIEEGNTYQVNFTIRYRGRLNGSPAALYRELRTKQRVAYAAYIETPDWSVLSLSPELFYRKRDKQIWARPMKGTSPRGRTLQEDAERSAQLAGSDKERAENLMIVDLLRNDLGKICEPGSIRVSHPLIVERYDTVLQMTSEIEGRTRRDLSLLETMQALFPSGSVTGAPKLRTMQIIRRLEKSPRGVYTGSIGFVSKEETVFSVAIRTAVITNGILEMGVGSGILHEADASREFEECRLKGRFLSDPVVEFDLLETILWLPEKGYQMLPLHLNRLLESSEYFLIHLKREDVIRFLEQNQPSSSEPVRIRLLVNKEGEMKAFASEVEAIGEPLRIQWATASVDSQDRFLFHKTTHRPLYQRELEAARAQGSFEVIFCNEKGEVTEGSFSNLWILKDGVHSTPPVTSGLLNGTYRQFLLSQKNFRAEERILFPADVEGADEIYISNAIRGLLRVAF